MARTHAEAPGGPRRRRGSAPALLRALLGGRRAAPAPLNARLSEEQAMSALYGYRTGSVTPSPAAPPSLAAER